MCDGFGQLERSRGRLLGQLPSLVADLNTLLNHLKHKWKPIASSSPATTTTSMQTGYTEKVVLQPRRNQARSPTGCKDPWQGQGPMARSRTHGKVKDPWQGQGFMARLAGTVSVGPGPYPSPMESICILSIFSWSLRPQHFITEKIPGKVYCLFIFKDRYYLLI